jgi:hypothetical protein
LLAELYWPIRKSACSLPFQIAGLNSEIRPFKT